MRPSSQLISRPQVLRKRKTLLKTQRRSLPVSVAAIKLRLRSSVRSTRQCQPPCAPLSLILTADAPFLALLLAQPQLLNTQVDPSPSPRPTTTRFPTSFTRSTPSALGTRAPLLTKFITRSTLEPTPSQLRAALQSKNSTTSNQATADRVARRPTRALTRNKESLWPTTLHVPKPTLAFAPNQHALLLPIADLHVILKSLIKQ